MSGTGIRVKDIAIRLKHIPVGFYVAVESENVTQRTSNKPASVSKDVVEWDDEIVLWVTLFMLLFVCLMRSKALGSIIEDIVHGIRIVRVGTHTRGWRGAVQVRKYYCRIA